MKSIRLCSCQDKNVDLKPPIAVLIFIRFRLVTMIITISTSFIDFLLVDVMCASVYFCLWVNFIFSCIILMDACFLFIL